MIITGLSFSFMNQQIVQNMQLLRCWSGFLKSSRAGSIILSCTMALFSISWLYLLQLSFQWSSNTFSIYQLFMCWALVELYLWFTIQKVLAIKFVLQKLGCLAVCKPHWKCHLFIEWHFFSGCLAWNEGWFICTDLSYCEVGISLLIQ